MESKMIFCPAIVRSLSEIGIDSNLHPFNAVQLTLIFEFVLNISFQFIFLVHVAQTPKEFLDVIYLNTQAALAFIAYLSIIFQAKTIFNSIDLLGKTVEEREFKLWKL